MVRVIVPNATFAHLRVDLADLLHGDGVLLSEGLLLLLEFSLLLLSILKNLLLLLTCLLLSLLGLLLGFLAHGCILLQLNFISILLAHGLRQPLERLEQLFTNLAVDDLFDLGHEIGLGFLGYFEVQLIIILIEFVHLNLPLARLRRIVFLLGVEINLHLKVKQEYLLLLTNGD